MTTDLPGLERKLEKLSDSLSKDTKKLLNAAGVRGKSIGSDSVQRDLGDMSMSNWRRGKPIQIATRFDIRSGSEVEIRPVPRAAGPMRVLEDGRRAGMSNGKKRKGRVGATAGRGTWSTAVARMEKELPEIAREHTRDTLRKLFGG